MLFRSGASERVAGVGLDETEFVEGVRVLEAEEGGLDAGLGLGGEGEGKQGGGEGSAVHGQPNYNA